MADYFGKSADEGGDGGMMGAGDGMSCPECGCKLRVDRAEEPEEMESMEEPAAPAPKKKPFGAKMPKAGRGMAEDLFGE